MGGHTVLCACGEHSWMASWEAALVPPFVGKDILFKGKKEINCSFCLHASVSIFTPGGVFALFCSEDSVSFHV